MRILIQSQNSNTPVYVVGGVPDLSAFTGQTLTVLQSAYAAGSYIELLEPEPQVDNAPQPLRFRDKLYGLIDSTEDNELFTLVYVPTTIAATNPATASAALTESRNILEGSLWNEPFSKAAFSNPFGSGSFDILKNFLSPEQIDIFEAAAREFNLLD